MITSQCCSAGITINTSVSAQNVHCSPAHKL